MAEKILHSKQEKDFTEDDNKLGERYFHLDLNSFPLFLAISVF